MNSLENDVDLERYVVCYESVVPVTSDFIEFICDDESEEKLVDSVKKCFHQYSSSLGLEETFIVDVVDQHNLFPQKNSDFVGICNLFEEPIHIRMKQTNDIIRIDPSNVLIVPNHILFSYFVSEKVASNQHNIVVYFNILPEKTK